jgi:hypothetical protein
MAPEPTGPPEVCVASPAVADGAVPAAGAATAVVAVASVATAERPGPTGVAVLAAGDPEAAGPPAAAWPPDCMAAALTLDTRAGTSFGATKVTAFSPVGDSAMIVTCDGFTSWDTLSPSCWAVAAVAAVAAAAAVAVASLLTAAAVVVGAAWMSPLALTGAVSD